MRTFSEIQVGTSLGFLFAGRRFFLSGRYDDVDVAELIRLGTEIDLSFYKTEMWRKDFEVTADEWAAFEAQFPAAIAGTSEVIRQAWIAREERDRQRAEEERLAAIERELRKQEKYLVLDIGDSSDLVLVARPEEHFLEFRHDWRDPVRRPISKVLHDMLIDEVGINEEETSMIAWEHEEHAEAEEEDDDAPFCMPQYRR
ncbi:hypothetical protein CFBP5875_01475 [Agrobacterium pusense]|uniref:hypothetical protein n=1 Tax=Agrobacterium pusense TaxID=648995 RepID=UPI0010BEEA70|nr:hypothetical protein [Agrobacterium pusense]QCL83363.1 hypothetical protein CFBP5875_01475 [Agrobacterium pusense]